MSDQDVAVEAESWLNNVANFGEVAGIAISVEMADGTSMSNVFGTSIEVPEQKNASSSVEDEQETEEATNEAELREMWSSFATKVDWNGEDGFQATAKQFGVTSGDKQHRIDQLVELGAKPDGSTIGTTEDDDSEAEPEPDALSDLSESEVEKLAATIEDGNEAATKRAKALCQTGEDYIRIGGTCPSKKHDDGKAIGRNFDKNGVKPFCQGCLSSKNGFESKDFDENQNNVFKTLINGGMEVVEAFENVA